MLMKAARCIVREPKKKNVTFATAYIRSLKALWNLIIELNRDFIPAYLYAHN